MLIELGIQIKVLNMRVLSVNHLKGRLRVTQTMLGNQKEIVKLT